MAKQESLRCALNAQGRPKLIINTDVLLLLGERDGLVYSKLVELDANRKVKKCNGYLWCSRSYIAKFLPYSKETIDRAIKDLKLYGLLLTKPGSNGENIYKLNYSKAIKVFIDKTEELGDIKALKSKGKDNPWGYDDQLENKKKREQKSNEDFDDEYDE